MTSFKPIDENPQLMWRTSAEGRDEQPEKWEKITLVVLAIVFAAAAVGGAVACCKSHSLYMDRLGHSHTISLAPLSLLPLGVGALAVFICVLGATTFYDTKPIQSGYKTDLEKDRARGYLTDVNTTLKKAYSQLGVAVRSQILTEVEGDEIQEIQENLKKAESHLYSVDPYLKPAIMMDTSKYPDQKQKIQESEATIQSVTQKWKELQETWKKRWNFNTSDSQPAVET